MKKALVPAVAILCLSAVEGCAASPHDDHAPTESQDTSRAIPDFSGPWAAAFTSTYRSTPSAEARQALSDQKITDQEYNYFVDRVKACMTDLGATNIALSDGQWEYTRPRNLAEDSVDECMKSDGIQIISLRDAIERNPEHLNENTIMASCLVKHHVAPSGYSGEDFARDDSVGTYPFDIDSTKFLKCNVDPLGKSDG